MIKQVLTIGDELLGQVSKKVAADEFNTPQLNTLIKDLSDTKSSIEGAVGIAAIQRRT
ncbi:MAG: Polypeptide deformylase [Burkholderiales bacterium]|jgi:peptide deformylase|nr:Polypeptide deformylase [Burkholderiales bacterium]